MFIQNTRINPIITPRFAVSCDHQLMSSLGKLSHDKDLHIQVGIKYILNNQSINKSVFNDTVNNNITCKRFLCYS
jgi:hypothetical protein